MIKCVIGMGCLLLTWTAWAAQDVLIVADEIPAMEVLAGKLKAEENLASQIVTQANMPADLSGFAAVIVYIHMNLQESAEKAFIAYTRAGGKLVVLHHSISSGKRKNKQWFSFLGVALPQGDVSQGGYKWIEPVTLDVVNLAPDHFIAAHKVKYPAQVPYQRSEANTSIENLPGFTLKESEVYLNHVLTGSRTVLLGLKYTDTKSSKTYMQNHAGWIKPAGKGWIIYLLPGHSALDFENPTYARIVLNAVVYQP